MGRHNDKSRVTYNTNSQVKFRTSMIKSNLYDYSDAYILVKGKITVVGAGAENASRAVDNKHAIFTYFAAFIDRITEINNTK